MTPLSEDFPYAWTAPGEFAFCGKCGWYLVLPSDALCCKCEADGKNLQINTSARAKALHDYLSSLRDAVAALRRDSGMPGLHLRR